MDTDPTGTTLMVHRVKDHMVDITVWLRGGILLTVLLGIHWKSWAYCADERKSASFFLLRRSANLGFKSVIALFTL